MSFIKNQSRFDEAIRRCDAANSADPNHELVDGVAHPRELLYARRLTDWVLRLRPDASEALRLAARCQHLRRWESPRERYPMERAGYLRWRADLKKFHAEQSGAILREVGYGDDVIARVQALNLKKDLGKDPDCQVLEDALCLVFLQYQFADLAAKTDDDKLVNALKKSWDKMSEQGRAEALKLNYGERELALIKT
ncbi:MAG TPA: DUF4202 domain-containing protein, partial [Verrucomicrobiae bacterium]|nr:DUF4202 domain-containing protein [Verrucomicrobiae bacterium]